MRNVRNINSVKRIAVIANDEKNKDLIQWSYYNKVLLNEHTIIAPGTEGNTLEGTLNKPVQKLLGGPLGGYEQLGEMISKGEVDVLVIFWDSVESQIQNNYVKALTKIALNANIIIANNRTTADFILNSDLMAKEHSIPVLEEVVTIQNATYPITGNHVITPSVAI
jgi:methylglyoxal synthase